ncbi:hypothetical protein [Serratia quinivorans]|uniref:hypothetical protein n=1 Tax=Serratia quinivorans TaxID=137545 RepID=UPI002177CDFB|nr:hypothetical protein [Serratia quinivorans]CAI1230760.1 Uncharacterised protein [Serratia quinivorans]CAI2159687.1 Uncharacterised protein [Serratia quinivorans]
MQFLKDLISSLSKHVDTRINSPILGTFSAIFVIMNWDKFVILTLGSGNIESRVNQFKAFIETLSTSSLFLAISLTLLYLFILPLVNHLVGVIQGIIENIRYTSNIGQKVKNEKERGKLINSRYKSEHQNEVAAQEIVEEIAISNEKIEQQKLLTERLKESCKAASTIIQSMYDKSKEIKTKLDISLKEREAAEIKLSRESMIKEREKLTYEKIKYHVQEKRKISQLTSSFYLVSELDLSLKEDSIKLSFSGLGSIIASVFGYSSFSKLLEDNNFHSESFDSINYIVYSEELITLITSILEDEHLDDFDSSTIFEHLQIMFEDKLDIRILTEETISERIRDTLEEDGLYDLINSDEVSSSTAETNAYFESVEDLQVVSYTLTDDSFNVEFECVISGTTHEDKPFCGDEINVSFINRSRIILGKLALGDSDIEEIKSSVKDYYEEDDYHADDNDSNNSDIQPEFEF